MLAGAGAVALAAAPLALDARFDFNPLNLHDQSAESVVTLRDLLNSGEHPPWSVDVLAAGVGEAEALAARLDGVEWRRGRRDHHRFRTPRPGRENSR